VAAAAAAAAAAVVVAVVVAAAAAAAAGGVPFEGVYAKRARRGADGTWTLGGDIPRTCCASGTLRARSPG